LHTAEKVELPKARRRKSKDIKYSPILPSSSWWSDFPVNIKFLLMLGPFLFSVTVQAKIFAKCYLARTLKRGGLGDFQGISLLNCKSYCPS
jgi:hypothetical protein